MMILKNSHRNILSFGERPSKITKQIWKYFGSQIILKRFLRITFFGRGWGFDGKGLMDLKKDNEIISGTGLNQITDDEIIKNEL